MGAMDGKVCVITGATSGIGYAAAVQLARAGARLVLVGRDRQRGNDAVRGLAASGSGVEVSLEYADLAQLGEVRRLAERLSRLPRIDVLVNNAGAIFRERQATADGLERTFALNHMGYYGLSRLLAPQLVASAPARIVSVASGAHVGARLDFADLQMTRSYDGWTAYRRSKLANILMTRELARRLAGTGVTANAVRPGFVRTRFGDNTRGLFRATLAIGKGLFAMAPEKGAQTVTFLASSPDVAGTSGLYFAKCRAVAPSTEAQDNAAALRLWQESARLAGLPEDGV